MLTYIDSTSLKQNLPQSKLFKISSTKFSLDILMLYEFKLYFHSNFHMKLNNDDLIMQVNIVGYKSLVMKENDFLI